jgi:hypothetical protein
VAERDQLGEWRHGAAASAAGGDGLERRGLREHELLRAAAHLVRVRLRLRLRVRLRLRLRLRLRGSTSRTARPSAALLSSSETICASAARQAECWA